MSPQLIFKNTIKRNIKYSGIYIVLLLLINLIFGYKVIKVKYFSYYPDYTYNRKSLFGKLNADIDSSSIVFIGNSLTQQYELAEFFKNVNVKNRGINGDNSSGILSRVGDIVKFHPKKIFIENGVNDLKEGVGQSRLLENFK